MEFEHGAHHQTYLRGEIDTMAAVGYNGPEKELTGTIIKCAIEVHRHFGCGLKEEAYEIALCWELRQLGLKIERQKACPVIYKGIDLSHENERPRRIDILVEDRIVVECKALPSNEYIFKAQCLTYLKMLKLRVGLVLNFGLPTLKAGIQHVINETKEEYLNRLRMEHPAAYRSVIEEENMTFSQGERDANGGTHMEEPVHNGTVRLYGEDGIEMCVSAPPK